MGSDTTHYPPPEQHRSVCTFIFMLQFLYLSVFLSQKHMRLVFAQLLNLRSVLYGLGGEKQAGSLTFVQNCQSLLKEKHITYILSKHYLWTIEV